MTVATARRPRIVWPRCLHCRAPLAPEWEDQDRSAHCRDCGGAPAPDQAHRPGM